MLLGWACCSRSS